MHHADTERIRLLTAGISLLLVACSSGCTSQHNRARELVQSNDPGFLEAAENGRLANEALRRSHRFVVDWLAYADPETGLIPRNLQQSRDFWNAQDAAADNYPFMVLTAALTDSAMFDGTMLQMLRAEEKFTSRLGRLPDSYSFSKRGFLNDEVVLEDIIFGASEYVKDGLLPLTEWLGTSLWSERMIGILDDIWAHAPVKTRFGDIVSTSEEVNGEMLQTLSRIYWMTGNEKYLEYAIRLGDYYLLGDHHPTRDLDFLRLRDHGCEIVSGLTELYATVHYALPEKKVAYREPIYTMLDRILEVGRNEHGLFFNNINPRTGEQIRDGIADTWGYTYNGYYTVYQLDGIEQYRDATLEALGTLNDHYRSYNWENMGVDGYADAIEGAINLYNREPVPSLKDWMDSEIHIMWGMQDDHPGPRGKGWQDSGIIEGMHPDGNFARTSLMYALWKTKGLYIQPWRPDVVFGAVERDGALLIHLSAEHEWTGRLVFDRQRHKTDMNLPHDWPRINQFPEWFTTDAEKTYAVFDVGQKTEMVYSGDEMQMGIVVTVQPGANTSLVVSER